MATRSSAIPPAARCRLHVRRERFISWWFQKCADESCSVKPRICNYHEWKYPFLQTFSIDKKGLQYTCSCSTHAVAVLANTSSCSTHVDLAESFNIWGLIFAPQKMSIYCPNIKHGARAHFQLCKCERSSQDSGFLFHGHSHWLFPGWMDCRRRPSVCHLPSVVSDATVPTSDRTHHRGTHRSTSSFLRERWRRSRNPRRRGDAWH